MNVKRITGIYAAVMILCCLFMTNCLSTDQLTVPQQIVAVDREVLTGSLWQGTGSSPNSYYKFFEDGYMLYVTTFSISESFGDFFIENVDYQLKWELTDGKLIYRPVNADVKTEAYFTSESMISGKNRGDDLTRVTEQEIIDRYNAEKYNFSPMSVLPLKNKRIPGSGPSTLGFQNPNEYTIAVAVIDRDMSYYLALGDGQGRSFNVPNSTYEIYFVLSSEPEILLRGDTVTVKNQKLELTFNANKDGNYGFERVNQ